MGSERPSTPAGRLGRPNGLKGFLGLYVEPEDLVYFEPGSTVFVGDRPLVVREIRRGAKGFEVAFADVTDRASAELIRNTELLVAERRSLDNHEFWPDDLIGLIVRPGGGRVVGVNHGPAQDRLVIERGEKRFEIPFVDALVPIVDVEEGFIEMVEIDGLSDLSAGNS
ncbi:MAG: ribosome maturation factor RimM [Acidimicrobiia bacterium]